MSSNHRSGQFKIDVPEPPGGMRTDFSSWPIVVITPPTRVMNDADYRAYLEWSRKYIVCTGQVYAMVLDNRSAAPITPNQRKILGEHMTSTKSFSQRYCAGVAMVFDSAVMRGVMTAIFWMSSPEYATKVCASVGEGVAWCESRVAAFSAGEGGARTG